MSSLDAEDTTRYEKTGPYKTRPDRKASYEVAQDSDRQDPKSSPRPPKSLKCYDRYSDKARESDNGEKEARKRKTYVRRVKKQNETKQTK